MLTSAPSASGASARPLIAAARVTADAPRNLVLLVVKSPCPRTGFVVSGTRKATHNRQGTLANRQKRPCGSLLQTAVKSWTEISESGLRSNVDAIRAAAGDGAQVLAVIKADGYGHGAELVAPVLVDCGVDW